MSSFVAQRLSGAAVDLSPRVQFSTTVAGSPATNAEVVVAQVTVVGGMQTNGGIVVSGFIALTQGTDGTHYNFRIRKTSVSGTILAATGAIELAATKLANNGLIAVDTAPTLPGQVYCLTATMTAASAASTVSATAIVAIVL